MRIAALLLAAAILAGCSGTTSSSTTGPTADQTHIDLLDNRYEPESATFKADQTAHFENKGANTHSVTVHSAAGVVLHDVTLKPGEKDDYRFPGAATYHVFCKFHTNMAAEVTTTA